jgi:hypothetical protein
MQHETERLERLCLAPYYVQAGEYLHYLWLYALHDWFFAQMTSLGWVTWNLTCLLLSISAVLVFARRARRLALLNGLFPAYAVLGSLLG